MQLQGKILVAGLLAGVLGTVAAQEPAVVGLWENVPAAIGKTIARPQYVFTNKKLTQATRFTGLQDIEGSLDVVCCVQVSELKPLRLADIIKKYAADPEFVAHFRSIKGLDYIYEAAIVPTAEQNESMRAIVATQVPGDLSPYSVPVLAAGFAGKTSLKPTFQLDGLTYRLRTTFSADQSIMHVLVKAGAETIKFSEGTFAH